MKSHEYAKILVDVGQFLLDAPEFDTPNDPTVYFFFNYDKEGFLSAVRALGSGTKTYKDDDLIFTVKDRIQARIRRDLICTLVRPAEYDCTPLLDATEESTLKEQ